MFYPIKYRMTQSALDFNFVDKAHVVRQWAEIIDADLYLITGKGDVM